MITVFANNDYNAPLLCNLAIWNGKDETCTEDDHTKEYDALSYNWGEGDATERLDIQTSSSQQPGTLWIRPGLAHALRELRYGDDPRHVWVDALCINQADEAEKSRQVERMSDIFTGAKTVCVWLGPAADHSGKAFKFMRRLIDLRDFDTLVRNDDLVEEFEAFVALMQRPWFERRWVVQELALARKAVVYCGDDMISWKEFADAVTLFVNVESRTKCINEIFRRSNRHGNPTNFLGDARFIRASRFVTATSDLFRKSDEGKILTYLMPLSVLVSLMSSFRGANPRDAVFSLLALSKDTVSSGSKLNEVEAYQRLTDPQRRVIDKLSIFTHAREIYRVDYSLSVLAVFKQFLAFTFKSSQSLDMICRPWAPSAPELSGHDKDSLPS